jgi:ferric-dicitrate binding protein FerR (iron transport regulator)
MAFIVLLLRPRPNRAFQVETDNAIATSGDAEFLVDALGKSTGVALLNGSVSVQQRAISGSGVVLDYPSAGTDVREIAAPTLPHAWAKKRLEATHDRATFDRPSFD